MPSRLPPCLPLDRTKILIGVGEESVFGLEVAVSDPGTMQSGDSLQDAVQDPFRDYPPEVGENVLENCL